MSDVVISHDGFFYHKTPFGNYVKGLPDYGPKRYNAEVTCAPKDALISETLSKTPVEKTSGYVPDKFTADDVGSVLEEMWRG